MKKLLLVLSILLLVLTGCGESDSRPETIITPIEGAVSTDMSSYDNMDAHDHAFLEIKATDLLNLVNDGGSGIFFLGYPECYACNVLISIADEAAKEVGVNIYTIGSLTVSGHYAFFKALNLCTAIVNLDDCSCFTVRSGIDGIRSMNLCDR